MEEGKPSVAAAENDEERVDEFKKFGEVEDLSPEEDGAAWTGLVRWEAEDPAVVGHLGESGKGTSDGHDEGEDEENEVVKGGDEAEECGIEGGEMGVVEGESEKEVGEEGYGEEERGGAPCLVGFPLEIGDDWMVN